jgi:hypothetical protein
MNRGRRSQLLTETVGGLMRRIAEDSGEVRLVFDGELDRCWTRGREHCTCERCEQLPAAFIGYEIGNALYSSLATVPSRTRARAAELVVHERDRLVELDYMDEDLRQAIELDRGRRGRPRQAACRRGHALRSARLGSDGRRHCRRCEALVRTNARKSAGHTARFEAEIERVG